MQNSSLYDTDLTPPPHYDKNVYDVCYKIPQTILIEVTNRCNYACSFCSHSCMTRKKSEIEVDLLKRILHEAYNIGVRRVGLYRTGEMFLCKNISAHIANAKSIGYEYIYADTNGALANHKNLEECIAAGLDSIKFSINAGTRETYKLIHGQDKFDTVISNLKLCYRLKKKLNKKMKLLVSYVVTRQNENEIEVLRNIISEYIDDFMVHPFLASFLSRYNIDCGDLIPLSIESEKIKLPCRFAFDMINITREGYLTACCVDFNNDLLLVDLNKTSLEEAWTSKNAVSFRKAHIDKTLNGLLCNNCVAPYMPYQALSL